MKQQKDIQASISVDSEYWDPFDDPMEFFSDITKTYSFEGLQPQCDIPAELELEKYRQASFGFDTESMDTCNVLELKTQWPHLFEGKESIPSWIEGSIDLYNTAFDMV